MRPRAEAGFTVIAPDLRGPGDSAKPAGRYTKREEAEDLHHWCATWGKAARLTH